MFRAGLLVLAVAFASCSAKSETEVLSSVGIVEYGETRGDEFVFGLSRVDQQFRFDLDAVQDFNALLEVLQASSDTGRSMRIVYDARSGRFGPGGMLPTYDVRSVEYDGTTIRLWRPHRLDVTSKATGESALARGLAYYSSSLPAEAIPALEEALTSATLRPQLQALALKVHGNALKDAVWVEHEFADDAVDRQLVRALDDFRRWSRLEPRNHEAQLAIGLVLRDLGAYEEAIEIFRRLLAEWPEQGTRLATRIGATFRIMGDYPRALATLDEFAAGEEPPLGMMFHYHRGWILNLMGRHEEAVREFNLGLGTQPDYGGAFEQRACAYAQLGRLEEALADRRRADDFDAEFFADSRVTPAVAHDLAWAKSVIATLVAAIAAGDSTPDAAPCAGAWQYGEVKRIRSRYLPDADAGDAPAIDAG